MGIKSKAGRTPGQAVMSTGLKRLLTLVFLLFALLVVNSVYLGTVTGVEHLSGETYQDYFYLLMFLVHLVLGLLLIVPFLIFGIGHMRRAIRRRNRNAVRAGIALFTTAFVLLFTGVVLTRFGFFEINDPGIRRFTYWIHVITPFAAAWLFVLHRLAGPRIKWRTGTNWAVAAGLFALAMVFVHTLTQQTAIPSEDRPFLPGLVQIGNGDRIPALHLNNDEVCAECHEDIARQSEVSMHRLSSFNNPAYRFSIEDTRAALLKRDGNVDGSQLCAVCHDPVPLFEGSFSDASFDPDSNPSSQAGITCVSCHAITQINSPRGNGDYTIVDPPRYPFAFSKNPALKFINRQLVKAKPGFHKSTFLKPLHKTAEFCSACHKVHLPFELNRYRWLRGQNHYDSFLLSGVSGHRVDSFYYPDRAVPNCAQCHMPATPSEDPAARDLTGTGTRSVHNHLFAAANTAVPYMLGLPDESNAARRNMLAGATRVDIFGLKEQGAIDGELHAPLGTELPLLRPGNRYLLETVIRTKRIGHLLTQGTADSNELWLDVTLRMGDRVIGRSGGLDDEGAVDPWSYFVNAYLLDKNGNRIQRRNAHDIHVALYDHQIPPGAASVVHYAFEVPVNADTPVTVEVKLLYRKFETGFYRHVKGSDFVSNDLPIVTLAEDRITLPVSGADNAGIPVRESEVPAWERWNDYGIGLLRKSGKGSSKGELRQAEAAFSEVERLGRADGAINLARVFFKEGRLTEAAQAIHRAGEFDPPAPDWTRAWYSALVDRQLGNLNRSIESLEAILDNRFAGVRERGFDFSYDIRVWNKLGRTLFERARQERGKNRAEARRSFLERAKSSFERTLEIDPEDATAHFNLASVLTELGDARTAQRHRTLHERYRPDDQAIERAVTVHRSRNPAANHAAEAVAVYDLQRDSTQGSKKETQLAQRSRVSSP